MHWKPMAWASGGLIVATSWARSGEHARALARHSITASAAPAVVKQRLLAGVDAWLA